MCTKDIVQINALLKEARDDKRKILSLMDDLNKETKDHVETFKKLNSEISYSTGILDRALQLYVLINVKCKLINERLNEINDSNAIKFLFSLKEAGRLRDEFDNLMLLSKILDNVLGEK